MPANALRGTFNLTMPLSAWLGWTEAPGDVPGYGPIDAEDSRTLADALVEGLRDEAMAVDVAYDGLQAAMKLDLYSYDVVVLDRDLPGIRGDTVCRMITESENQRLCVDGEHGGSRGHASGDSADAGRLSCAPRGV